MIEKPWLQNYDQGVASELVYPDLPLQDLLIKSAQKFPHHICLQYRKFEYTYEEVVNIAKKTGAGLQKLGIKQGQRIGLVLPNVPQFVFSYYGILLVGGVVVPLNPAYTYNELVAQCKLTEIRIIIGWEGRKEVLAQLSQEQRMRALILTDDNDLEKISIPRKLPPENDREIKYSDLLDERVESLIFPQLSKNSSAVIQFSGGTTGTPKAIDICHRNLVANTLQFREWLKCLVDGQEHFLDAIPLSHVYGMVIGLNVGLAMGATIHLIQEGRDTQAILETIQKQNISFFPGIPSIYYAITQNLDVLAGRYSLSSIKACISGSAPLDPKIRISFERLTGGKLVEGYGLSEAPTATHCNPILGENRNGSIGLPLPDVDCRIAPLSGYPKGVGELRVKGPQVMIGYLNQPDETRNAFEDEWLKTGDICRMDEAGYFYLLGRNKELIKVGGFQVWPREVEEVLMQLPEIQEVAVTGIPDLAKGERVKAWIVLREGKILEEEKIRAYCKNLLAHYKVPTEIAYIQTIPRTPVGKILKNKLI
ncbi:MAG: AMP-binding protein [Anaerolineaceae bacterium]